VRLNFKFLGNKVTITIYYTILSICYYSKSKSRGYLKILPVIKIRVSLQDLIFKIF